MSAVHLAVDDPSPCETCEGTRQISDHGGVGYCPACCCWECGLPTPGGGRCTPCALDEDRRDRWRQ